jgi:hypothetical protein
VQLIYTNKNNKKEFKENKAIKIMRNLIKLRAGGD